MSLWRVAAWLVVLCFFLTSMAMGADNITYSGIPGKWKRGSKGSKNSKKTASQSDSQTQEDKKEGNTVRTIRLGKG